MTALLILLIISTLFCGFMTIMCLKGVDWVMISGIYGKDERQKFKNKYDTVAMNRYIGKMIMLPATILCAATIPLFVFDLPDYSWLEAVLLITIAIPVIAVIVLTCIAIPKVLGNYFEKKEHHS